MTENQSPREKLSVDKKRGCWRLGWEKLGYLMQNSDAQTSVYPNAMPDRVKKSREMRSTLGPHAEELQVSDSEVQSPQSMMMISQKKSKRGKEEKPQSPKEGPGRSKLSFDPLEIR